MMINTVRDLGAAIRDRRKAIGLDQVALATRVGVSRRWVIQVENGSSGASFVLILRALKALDMQMSLNTVGHDSRFENDPPLPTPDLDAVLARARKTAPHK